jgi:hypothetical protein
MVAVTASAPATPWNPTVKIDDINATSAMDAEKARTALPRVEWLLFIECPLRPNNLVDTFDRYFGQDTPKILITTFRISC